jgi:glycosyltransferase involved in cell wall biosynthesis
MKALVVTVVHHPHDARIAHRQIPALLDAGHAVTYAAPFTAFGAAPPEGTNPIDLPRSMGRERLAAARAARAMLSAHGPLHDVVVLHDPELLAATIGVGLPAVVWDVHEDTAAAVTLKPWLPEPLRRPTAAAIGGLERWAERHVHLLLAEESYAQRFTQPHPVVPNTTLVPAEVSAPGDDRAVYLGAVTAARGIDELIALGGLLRPDVSVELIGAPHPSIAERVTTAHAAGLVTAHGFVPSDRALPMLDGALVGLSLLHDEPNYRHSRPTKIIEYMAHGIPVITTPLPEARRLVESAGCGFVVDFGDVRGAADAVLALRADPDLRQRLGRAGHRTARDRFDWSAAAPRFVAALEAAAGAP